jgi:cell division protease FtsH
MVCEWGMSDLGPINFGSNSEVFLGRDFVKERNFSEETASAVDNEIHKLLKDAYAEAKNVIEKHRDVLDALANELVERETLEADDIDEIIRRVGGKDILPPKPPRKQPGDREPVVIAPAPGEGADVAPAAEEIPPGKIIPGTA